MALPNFFGKQYESASNFLDDLEMAFLVSGRDEEEGERLIGKLVLKDSAKNWFQNLEPGRKTNWETVKETFLSKYGGLDNPEHLWHRISSLHQATSRTYLTYESQFLRLWAEWEASLAEGERAPNFLKKEKFLAGLFSDLQEKVKGKFPETFEEALQIARVKDRKLEYQAHTSRVEHPQGPTMADERLPPAPTTTPEDPHLELLQRVTNQLDNLSINMVQGVRQQQPQPNNERMPNGPRRQPQRRDYFCYNCGEEGHGMYFCPHPRNFNAQAGRGRQQVTPPRARPPPQIQPQILQNPQMVAQPQVLQRSEAPQPVAEIPLCLTTMGERLIGKLVLKDSAKNWFQNLEPGRKTNWETVKETFLSKYGGLDNPEHLWHRISSLHQATSRTYLTYESQFLRLWAEWEASLAEGERAPNFLKKEKFLAGLFSDLQEKVKGKFPETFEEALQIARVKDRKLEYQAHTSRVEHPQGPTMADERLPPAPTTTPEDPHLELLQRVTNQLDNLSINMVQGVRQQQPQPNNERMPNGPRRQPQRRDYFCYNCGEEGHGMYFCPHPRNFNAQAGRGRQQVTPPRARPPPQIQPQILQNPQMVAQPQVLQRSEAPQPVAEIPLCLTTMGERLIGKLVLKDSAKNWFQNLEPGRKTNWETVKETFLSKYGGLDNPEHLWHRISSLHQATSRTYLTYESQFLRLWAEWEASLAEGERAPNFLKKEKFLAGLFSDLQEKVKGKFPETFEEALQIARVKDRKLEYQAHTSRVEHPQGPTMADERLPPAPTTTPEDPHLELLQRVTNQLDNLSINMVQGVRQQQPQPNNERMPNGPRRQPQRRDYFCYNCGEEGHGMYFCPHPRNFNAQAGRGRQQVTPPRARPPPQIQPQILQNPQMVAQPQVLQRSEAPQPVAEIPLCLTTMVRGRSMSSVLKGKGRLR
ncbi:hypothetical protein L7F22_065785 [Adiantum nelumboides]|nr:hypothetical protein [Adiantum nelumboides]